VGNEKMLPTLHGSYGNNRIKGPGPFALGYSHRGRRPDTVILLSLPCEARKPGHGYPLAALSVSVNADTPNSG